MYVITKDVNIVTTLLKILREIQVLFCYYYNTLLVYIGKVYFSRVSMVKISMKVT